MTKNIQNLLALTAEFPIRKRVDYTRDADLQFVTRVLHALRDAAPEIELLSRQVPEVTSQLRAQGDAPAPSTVASPAPQTDSSTHNRAVTPKTDGTVASSGRKAGTSRKLSSGLARLNAARQAAAAARKPSAKPSAPSPAATVGAAPPAPQPAIPETGPA